MTTPLILHFAPDNASLCVRLALLELGVAFKTVLVDRAADGQNAPGYLAMNPNGLIPVLETQDGPLYETAAILLWLADHRPGVMFPAVGDPARGAALVQLFWLSNTLHTTLRMAFYPDLYSEAPECLTTMARLDRQLAILQDSSAPWLQGDTSSILACYLAPMLRWPALYGAGKDSFDLRTYPSLLAFAQAFEVRPAAQAAGRAEGLGPTPFSAPSLPNPPEGSAT